MNREEWVEYVRGEAVEPIVRGEEFPAPEEGMRLLCRGYHSYGNGGGQVRIWLRFDGQIGRQHNDGDIVFQGAWYAEELVPTKRAYREDTDLLFAQIMRDRLGNGHGLTFTTWLT